VKSGCNNLVHHIQSLLKYGVKVVVALNQFASDTEDEISVVREEALGAGASAAVMSSHHAQGGIGAVELAKAVIHACEHSKKEDFKFLYNLELPIKDKIEAIAKSYGASNVSYSPLAEQQIERYAKQGFAGLPICLAKVSQFQNLLHQNELHVFASSNVLYLLRRSQYLINLYKDFGSTFHIAYY